MKLLLALLLLLSDPGLAVRYEGTSAALSWTQPADIQRTCLYRFYGAEYPSARCWDDLSAGRHSSVYSTLDPDPAYRAHKGDVFKLCFSQQTSEGLHCVFVATVAIGDLPAVHRVYLPLASGGPAPSYQMRLPVVVR